MTSSSKPSNQESPGNANQHKTGFLYRKDVIRWILRVFYFCCAILFFIDFFIHRHTETDFEKLPTFYPIYGLVACFAFVVIAKWIKIFITRDESYYDETEDSLEYLRKQGLELPKLEKKSKRS